MVLVTLPHPYPASPHLDSSHPQLLAAIPPFDGVAIITDQHSLLPIFIPEQVPPRRARHSHCLCFRDVNRPGNDCMLAIWRNMGGALP